MQKMYYEIAYRVNLAVRSTEKNKFEGRGRWKKNFVILSDLTSKAA